VNRRQNICDRRLCPAEKRRWFLLFAWLVLFLPAATAQVQRYPADIQPVLPAPYSVYLSDYTAEGSNRLTGNIVFNDFNEASWTFKLRLSVESMDVRLRTKNGFTPATPITVQPGVPYVFSGSDWAEYFNFNNLDVSGPNTSKIINSGRLPEGLYSMCLQVLDYHTGELLSEERCANIWMQLLDPPRILSPEEGKYLDPAITTTFPITWQLFNTQSANTSMGTDFQLTMWELTEPGANPLSAVQNGQALQVFQSDLLQNTNYTYGPADPLLEAGKVYVYRVQALDADGKDRYKNGGYSEFGYFIYGWPKNGKISLLFPEEGGGFRREDTPKLLWSGPDNMLDNQSVNYEIVVKKMQNSQAPSDAINLNENWHYRRTPPTYSKGSQPENLDPVTIEQKYAWQIRAFTGDQEIAKSGIGTFFGPALVDYFYAGNVLVWVDYLSNKDLNNLAGGGRVRLTPDPNVWTDITFSGMKLLKGSREFSLLDGEMLVDIDPIAIPLEPLNEDNGEAHFVSSRVRLNKNGIYLFGKWTWSLPMAAGANGMAKLESTSDWADYNGYRLLSNLKIADNSSFSLLDPLGFNLEIAKGGNVFINDNRFRFALSGQVTAPTSIKNEHDGNVKWSFTNAEQLRTIQSSSADPFRVVNNTHMMLAATKSIIDFSDGSSPGSKAGSPNWKGIYIDQATVKLATDFDSDGQFSLAEVMEQDLQFAGTPTSEAFIDFGGLTLHQQLSFEGQPLEFNTFPAHLTGLIFDITNQQVNEGSRLNGNFLLPFIDTATPFEFQSQLYSRGFRPGTLANLGNKTFRFNPEGGELAVDLTIRKGQMADNDHLQLTMDVTWPSVGVTLIGVDNFNIWGNYSAGFFVPEGILALTNQVNATFRGYPVTIDALSAGRSQNYYGFAISGKVVMGEDVSGDDGAPAFNLYSMVQNPALDMSYMPAPTQGAFDLAAAENGLDEMEAGLAAMEEDLNQKVEEQAAALQNTTADLIASASSGIGGQEHSLEELVSVSAEPEEVDYEAIADRKERLLAYLELFRGLSNDPTIIDGVIEQIKNSEEDFDNMSNVLAELKRFATDFAVDQVASLGDGFLEKVDKVTRDVNGVIIVQANQLTSTVKQEIDQAVGNLISSVSSDLIASLSQDAPDAALIVEEVANSTREAIVNELTNSINSSVNQNIVFPVTSFVSSNLNERAQRLVRQTAEKVVLGALNQDQNPSEIMQSVLDGFDDELKGLGDELAAQVDMDKMLEAIKKLGQDAVAGISAERIVNQIKKGALEAVTGAVARRAAAATSELVNNLLGDKIGISIPVDFAAIGGKLLSGGSPKDLLFDPIPISVRSPTLDLNGVIHFTKDHAQYGDMWSGDVTAFVKVPKPFQIQLAYMNGRKDNVSYWMAEVGKGVTGEDEVESDKSKMGEPMGGETLKETTDQIELGMVKVAAIQGRVYHHMAANALEGIVPDGNNKYGAYLHMVAFGPQDGKVFRLEIDAQMDVATSGDFTIDFLGNAQMLSRNPKINFIDETAVIQGTIALKYNSAEQHFLGMLAATFEQPGVLCAQGNLLVDVKPGVWHVALGSQQERLTFILNCAGFGPTGWLDLNQNTANLGLGLEFMFRPDPINLNVGVAKLALLIEAGAAGGVQATVQYNPNFQLMEAGLWLELWAQVLLNYETVLKKGTVNLVNIYMAANANMRFDPAPTILYGKVNGQIKVLFLNFGFDKDFKMNL
jgi:hypothetical protein